MDRKRVWKKTIVLELEVPEDTDGIYQCSRISWVVEEDRGNRDGFYCNSVKVDMAPDLLNAVSGDLIQYFASQLPEWEQHIKASADARMAHAKGKASTGG